MFWILALSPFPLPLQSIPFPFCHYLHLDGTLSDNKRVCFIFAVFPSGRWRQEVFFFDWVDNRNFHPLQHLFVKDVAININIWHSDTPTNPEQNYANLLTIDPALKFLLIYVALFDTD